MASSLADFQGNAIYLDTNVLVGLVDASSVYHLACAAFFQRAVDPDRPIQLFTATLTLDEVIFVLLQETVAREPYSITRNRSQYLRDHGTPPRDAIHLAVMKRLGLTAIASDDEGFDNRRGSVVPMSPPATPCWTCACIPQTRRTRQQRALEDSGGQAPEIRSCPLVAKASLSARTPTLVICHPHRFWENSLHVVSLGCKKSLPYFPWQQGYLHRMQSLMMIAVQTINE